IAAWSSGRVLFHWAAPGYLMLFPLLGAEVARRLDQVVVRRLLAGTVAFVAAGVIVVGSAVQFDWLHPVIAQFSRKDPVIEAVDWTSLRADLTRRGLLHAGTVVGVPNWRDAGKVAYALGPDVTTVCLNRDARQFAFSAPAAMHIGQTVLILAPEHAERVPAVLGSAFGRIEALPPSPILHAGRVMRQVAVFRGQDLRAWPPPG
ncbi:MAG TPA: hypothetical protein VFW75_04860, partial [Acetobacteraceae bacterium]|nr:hypothetical protein [Acetobacteraceae bacterium]